jgi:tRNA pseudouridine32 synthase/23S rRNA pseudouridine746 synthase/23S rRNA pseudouridine1911/1915/1917 synthase
VYQQQDQRQEAQDFLRSNWPSTKKTYYAIVHGKMVKKQGTISSYLLEDDDYVVHSTTNTREGKLAHTAYEVMKETSAFSLVKIDLLTGRKNQIRVHMAEAGHPVVGDKKYGKPNTKHHHLALHAQAISLTHPFSKARLTFEAKVPDHFNTLIGR